MERAEPPDLGDTHLDNMAAVQVESRLRLIAPSNRPFFFILAFGIHSLLLLRPPIIDAKLHPPVSTLRRTLPDWNLIIFCQFISTFLYHSLSCPEYVLLCPLSKLLLLSSPSLQIVGRGLVSSAASVLVRPSLRRSFCASRQFGSR